MINHLIDIISREARLFESFLNLLEQQKRALVANDLKELDRITHLQQEAMATSHRLNIERMRTVVEIKAKRNFEQDLTISRLIALADSEQAARLKELRELLLSLNDKILEVRNTNALLINQSREMISRTMAMLSRSEHADNVYGRDASRDERAVAIALDRRILMPGLFAGIEAGKRALLTHQMVLQTIGQNIANVNTPGYTRQRVSIQATSPEDMPIGLLGTGVQVSDIRHIRDLFLGQQEREATKSLGQWSYKEKTLSEIEASYNEPQENSLSALLTRFWDSWSELATNSDSISNRKAVVATANQLVAGFQQLSQKMSSLREATDRDVASMVADINQKTAEIARLNQDIARAELGGGHANDLRDARDLTTQELAQLIDVRTVNKPNGEIVVQMGAMALVDGSRDFAIDYKTTNNGGVELSKIIWKGTNVELTNLGGQLAGLTESRDLLIPKHIEDIDELAKTFIEQVNALHVTGYGMNGTTNVAFFDPNFTSAATMRLSTDVTIDPSKVAASSSAAGDNNIALAVSELRNARVMTSGTGTIGDFYDSLVSTAGLQAKEATTTTQNFELLVQQIGNARQSVEGVNLDEEMADLIKYQHAYDAAARVISAMDQALDTVISSMGMVGR